MCAAAATQVEEATVVMEDDAPAAPVAAGSLRRLSSWTIAIPYVDSYEDDAKREKIPVFCIDVERNDRKEGEARGGGEENLATSNSPDCFRVRFLLSSHRRRDGGLPHTSARASQRNQKGSSCHLHPK